MPGFGAIAEKSKAFIGWLEGIKLPFHYWIAYLYCVFIARGLLEGFLEANHAMPKLLHLFVHWPFWNFNFLISIVFILFLFTRQKIERISRAVFFFSFLILLVPAIDWLVSGGKGFSLVYLMKIDRIFAVLFSFGGLLGESVITPGQSAAIWAAAFLIFCYVLAKKKSLVLSVASVVLFYLAGMFFAVYPLIPAMAFGFEHSFNREVISVAIPFIASLGAVQAAAWLYLYKRKTAAVLLKSLKPLRALHYSALVLLGAVFALYIFPGTIPNWPALFSAAVSVFFAFEFCLAYNNIYDKEIPKSIGRRKYEFLAIAMLLFSLFFIATTNTLAMVGNTGILNSNAALFLFFALILGLYYSMPPLRLKRLGFVNNAVIGLLSAFTAAIGFLSQSPELTSLPLMVGIAVFVTFSLAANIKDLKDWKKDKKEGIKTIPVILGKERGLLLVAALTSLSFLIPPLLLGPQSLLLPGAAFGVANFLLLKKLKIERVTFLLYFAFALLLAAAWLGPWA